MNIIFEAIKEDGTHALVSPSVISGLHKTAKLYRKTERGARRLLGQMIANMMYCCGYIVLTQIKYDHDGNQSRAVIAAKSI